MEKKLYANKETDNDDFNNLLEEVAKFREANRKFLIPDLGNYKPVKNYRIIQTNNTFNIDAKNYG